MEAYSRPATNGGLQPPADSCIKGEIVQKNNEVFAAESCIEGQVCFHVSHLPAILALSIEHEALSREHQTPSIERFAL